MNDTLLIASVYVQKNYSIVITTLQGGCRSQDYKCNVWWMYNRKKMSL